MTPKEWLVLRNLLSNHLFGFGQQMLVKPVNPTTPARGQAGMWGSGMEVLVPWKRIGLGKRWWSVFCAPSLSLCLLIALELPHLRLVFLVGRICSNVLAQEVNENYFMPLSIPAMRVGIVLRWVFESAASLDPRRDLTGQGFNGFLVLQVNKRRGEALLQGLMLVVGNRVDLGIHLLSCDDPEQQKSRICSSKGQT